MITATRRMRMVLAAALLGGVMTAGCGSTSNESAPAAAADAPADAQGGLAGRWEGKTDLGGEVSMDATVSGDVLTGMFKIDKQHESIRNGTITGNTFTFNVALGGVANVFSGELKDGQVSIVRVSPDGPSAPLLLARAK